MRHMALSKSTGAMVMSLLPMFIAAFPLSHHRTINGSMDFILVFLLLMQLPLYSLRYLICEYCACCCVSPYHSDAWLQTVSTNLARREHALTIAIAHELDL